MTIEEIEKHYQVNVDSHDESGSMVVYTYVEGTRIGVDFHGMNPPIAHIEAAARGISQIAEALK